MHFYIKAIRHFVVLKNKEIERDESFLYICTNVFHIWWSNYYNFWSCYKSYMYENSDNNSSNCWAGNHNFPTSAKLILEENSLARYYLCEWFPVFLNQYVVFSTIPIRYYYFGISSHSVQFHQFFPSLLYWERIKCALISKFLPSKTIVVNARYILIL